MRSAERRMPSIVRGSQTSLRGLCKPSARGRAPRTHNANFRAMHPLTGAHAALATGCYPDGSAPDPCFLGRGRAHDPKGGNRFRINHASAVKAKRVFCPPSACPIPASSSRTGRNAGRCCPRAARERFATPRAGIPHSFRSQDRIRNAPLHERDSRTVTKAVTVVKGLSPYRRPSAIARPQGPHVSRSQTLQISPSLPRAAARHPRSASATADRFFRRATMWT
jgi:hypothetical protein